jgi:integrase
MMTPYLPKGRTIHRVNVPRRDGGFRVCSSGTRDKNTARKIEQMVRELGRNELRAWDILEAVTSRRVALATLWDWWVTDQRDLRKIRARVAEVDLAETIPAWRRSVLLRASEDSAAHYAHAVQTFAAADGTILRSTLTTERLRDWLGRRTRRKGKKDVAVLSGTARRYHVAMSSFIDYCRSVGLLDVDPMADVPTPAAGAPRDRHLDTPEAIALVQGLPEPFRTITALLAGTGIEVSVALGLRVADFDHRNQEVRARGTKTKHAGPWRDRLCKIATWAWPYLEAALQGKPAKALLWPDVDRWQVADATMDACEKLEIRDYTPRDHRHTWAVRAVKSGMPIELVSRQLGHKDGVLCLKVYGRYVPRQEERERWEVIAAVQDKVAQEESAARSGINSGIKP